MLRSGSVLPLAALFSLSAWPQEFRATISRRITDATGAYVPNAKVFSVNRSTQETTNVTSDNPGAYTLHFLRPGQYKITSTANGFKSYNREKVGSVGDSENLADESHLYKCCKVASPSVIDCLSTGQCSHLSEQLTK